MWDTNDGRYFYRRSYRSAPPKLIPAIVSCQGSICLIFFGIFFLVSGFVARFVAGDDSPPSKEFDSPFFNESRKEFAKGPRLVGTILLIISSVMIVISIIGFVVAFILYRNYEKDRRQAMLSNPSPQTFTNPQSYFPSPNGDYPSQAGFQYPTGYQALSQNVVYNPTTEPNQPIINS